MESQSVDKGVVHGVAGTSIGGGCPSKINWARCVICQVDKDEPLQCPAISKRGTSHLQTSCRNFSLLMPYRHIW